MRRHLFPLSASLLLTSAALAGCSGAGGGGTARAAKPDPGAEPRANALQHDYVASPQAHFDQMAAESREQEAAKAETAAATGKGRKATPKGSAPAAGFPAPSSGAGASGFPAPTGAAAAPAAGFPAPSGPVPAPEPVARGDCEPNPCIGGDPCIHREPALPGCPPNGDVALNQPPRAAR
jgi:hypothetical protein